jgi:hypothetical protein
MKSLFTPLLLIDCGKASKRTKGGFMGGFTEVGNPPFNRYLS